jgi:toxin YhaV
MIANGWTLMAHLCFTEQLALLKALVERERGKNPSGYKKKATYKRLLAINKLTQISIPNDPSADIFRLGNTLGPARRNWFRAKFFQQYRLFYRFDSDARVIVYAWVNDDSTKRAYDSKSDAYAVFVKMLDSGNPPDGFDTLLASASSLTNTQP